MNEAHERRQADKGVKELIYIVDEISKNSFLCKIKNTCAAKESVLDKEVPKF